MCIRRPPDAQSAPRPANDYFIRNIASSQAFLSLAGVHIPLDHAAKAAEPVCVTPPPQAPDAAIAAALHTQRFYIVPVFDIISVFRGLYGPINTTIAAARVAAE